MYLPIDKRKARKDIKDIGTVRNTVTRVVVEIYILCVLYITIQLFKRKLKKKRK